MGDSGQCLGVRSVAAVLPPMTRSLGELDGAGALVSTRSALEELGFERVHVVDAEHGVEWLAVESAQRALANGRLEPGDIDVLIWVSALAETHVRPRASAGDSAIDELLGRFHYRASWLQEELHLDRARVTAIAQQGCAGMFSALSMAHSLLVADGSVRNVLCVGVDALPNGAPREILYNLISDAGCAVVVSREDVRCRWLAFEQVSKGYYWNIVGMQKEIIASYFPTSRAVIRELLQKAGVAPGDISWIVPTGVSRGSWNVLANLSGLKVENLFRAPQGFGHTIAADNIVHLEALLASGRICAGENILLFTYGFGSTWCGIVLEST